MPYIVAHLPFTVLKILRHGLKVNRLGSTLKGLLAGVLDSAIHFRERDPVAGKVYRISRALRRE
jgi:hypothetical protein